MRDTKPFTIAEQFATPSGHTYFLAGDGPHQGRWAVADGSSRAPWATTDGVLLVNKLEPIEFGGTHIALSLDGPDGPTRTIISPAESLIVAARLGMVITHDGRPYRLVGA